MLNQLGTVSGIRCDSISEDFALSDTMGLLLGVVVHPADVQDRDGAKAVLPQARRLFPFVKRIIGDAGYQGSRMAAAVARAGC